MRMPGTGNPVDNWDPCRGNAARKGRIPSPDASGPRSGCINRFSKTSSPLWRFGCLKVWLGQALATIWDQATGKGAVWDQLGEAPSGADPFTQEMPVLQSLSEWCWSHAWAQPLALWVPSCWFEFWLDCGPVLSYRYIWRPILLAEPGCHPWASSACPALPCPPHWLPSSWMTFPCCANPPLASPQQTLTGSHSRPLLKTRGASLPDGFRNYLMMYKNSFSIAKVHF